MADRRAKGTGVEAELLTLEGAGHGFKGKDAETAEKALLSFFDKYLYRHNGCGHALGLLRTGGT